MLPLAVRSLRNTAPFMLLAMPAASRAAGRRLSPARRCRAAFAAAAAAPAQPRSAAPQPRDAGRACRVRGRGRSGSCSRPATAASAGGRSATARWRRRAPATGRSTTSYGDGGTLIWFLPEKPVFVDGRQDPYPLAVPARGRRAWKRGRRRTARCSTASASAARSCPIESARSASLGRDGWTARFATTSGRCWRRRAGDPPVAIACGARSASPTTGARPAVRRVRAARAADAGAGRHVLAPAHGRRHLRTGACRASTPYSFTAAGWPWREPRMAVGAALLRLLSRSGGCRCSRCAARRSSIAALALVVRLMVGPAWTRVRCCWLVGLPLSMPLWALRPHLFTLARRAAAADPAGARAPLADPAAVRGVGQRARRRRAGRRAARRGDRARAAALAAPPRAGGPAARARARGRAAAVGPGLPGDAAGHRHLPLPVRFDGAHPRRRHRRVAADRLRRPATAVSSGSSRSRSSSLVVAPPRAARRRPRVVVGATG